MMRAFDILERRCDLTSHRILEASAGTGKTFAIEHAAVRLLAAGRGVGPPLELEELLIVTFTKAATADLRQRLRQALATASAALASGRFDDAADYLLAIVEEGDEARRGAALRLRRAVAAFDNAAVFTIHGFCHRMLNEELPGAVYGDPLVSGHPLYEEVVRDVLTTELEGVLLHPLQIKLLLDAHEKNVEKLAKDLVYHLPGGARLAPPPPWKEAASLLRDAIDRHRRQQGYSFDGLMDDFAKIKGRHTAAQWRQRAERFAAALSAPLDDPFPVELLLDDGLVFLELYEKIAAKDGAKLPVLRHEALIPFLSGTVAPLLAPQCDAAQLLTTVLAACRTLLRRRCAAAGYFSYDDLLRHACEAAGDGQLPAKYRRRYKAVIVDEFQDTDPQQWRLLRRLFLEGTPQWEGILLLVGDPKQSIYAFRQADIYTYLDAVATLGDDAVASLDTNWRSHPSLLHCLNALFGSAHPFMELPQRAMTLPYHPVKAGRAAAAMTLLPPDECNVTFVAADASADGACETLWHRHLIHEIGRLGQHYGLPYDCWAVLVRDRWQGKRLAAWLQSHGIRYHHARKQADDADEALCVLRDLLLALQRPRDRTAIKTAMLGRLLGYDAAAVSALDSDEASYLAAVRRFMGWRRLLLERGVGAFAAALLQDSDGEGRVIGRRLAAGDQPFLEELVALFNNIIGWEGIRPQTLERLIAYLDDMELCQQGEGNEGADAAAGVTIVTMHTSKGLEYDVVYAMGVATALSTVRSLILQRTDDGACLIPHGADEAATESCRREEVAEQLRQFYVAATRAKYKLYLPYSGTGTRKGSQGAAIEHFFQRAVGAARPSRAAMENYLAGLAADGAGCALDDAAAAGHGDVPPPALAAPPAPTLRCFTPRCSTLVVTSFSAMAAPQPIHYGDDALPPSWQETPCADVHRLPAGAATGTLLHSLLEEVPFALGTDAAALASSLLPLIEASPLAGWRDALIAIVEAALTMPLPLRGGGALPLCRLASGALYREAEFVYRAGDGLFHKGVIDLFFHHEGYYYLLDWKSNWLGPCDDAYGDDALQRAMEEHSYLLQARLYGTALRRYLAKVERRPFEECFGGVYYLFLRGLPARRGLWKMIGGLP